MSFTASKSFRFARNVSWNVLGQVGIVAVTFFATPYLVSRLGLETYGLYVLMHAASSYLLLLNFGSGGAAAKFISEYKALGDQDGVGAAIGYAATVHVVGVAAGAAVMGLWARVFAVRLFHVAPDALDLAVFVLRCAAAGAFGAALVQLAAVSFQGLQKFHLSNLLSLLQSGLVPLGVVGALALGLGLRGAASWFVLLNAALGLVAAVYVFRLERRTSPGVSTLSHRRFLGYALSLWLGQLAWIVMFQGDKVFIARALPLSDLTLYSIPSGLLQRLQVIPGVMAGVLVPMVSEMHGDVREGLTRMYLKTLRLLLWLVLPLLAMLFAFLPQLLTLWLGVAFADKAIWPVRILIAAQGIFLASYAPASVANGRGKVHYFSYVSWAQSGISLVCWWLLVPRLRLYGAAIGALLAQLIPALFYVPAVNRRILRLSAGRYFSEGLFPPLAGAAILLAAVLPVHQLATTWPRLVGLSLAAAALYAAATWLLFGEEDRQLVRDYLRWHRA